MTAPSSSSEAARCASTGIVPATPPLFQHPVKAAQDRWRSPVDSESSREK
jgi:hypothetical protein